METKTRTPAKRKRAPAATKKGAKNEKKTEQVAKRSKKVVTDDDKRAAESQAAAVRDAKSLNMLGGSFESIANVEQLRFPKTCVKCHGADIKVKKGRDKGKYMMVLPGQISAITAGICGSLESIGSQSPVLNFEFANEGRTLRCHGTIVNPSSAYLLMHFSNNGKSISCDSSFSEIVVFNKFEWVTEGAGGISQSSSFEVKNEIDWIDPPVLGNSYDDIALPESQAESQTSTPRGVGKKREVEVLSDNTSDSDDLESTPVKRAKTEDSEEEISPTANRRSTRARTPPRKTVTLDSDSEEGNSLDKDRDDEDDEDYDE